MFCQFSVLCDLFLLCWPASRKCMFCQSQSLELLIVIRKALVQSSKITCGIQLLSLILSLPRHYYRDTSLRMYNLSAPLRIATQNGTWEITKVFFSSFFQLASVMKVKMVYLIHLNPFLSMVHMLLISCDVTEDVVLMESCQENMVPVWSAALQLCVYVLLFLGEHWLPKLNSSCYWMCEKWCWAFQANCCCKVKNLFVCSGLHQLTGELTSWEEAGTAPSFLRKCLSGWQNSSDLCFKWYQRIPVALLFPLLPFSHCSLAYVACSV